MQGEQIGEEGMVFSEMEGGQRERIIKYMLLGVVAHTCNLSSQEAEGYEYKISNSECACMCL